MAAWNLPCEVASWIVQMAFVLDRRIAWRLLPLLVGALFGQGRQTVASWLRARAAPSRDPSALSRYVTTLVWKAAATLRISSCLSAAINGRIWGTYSFVIVGSRSRLIHSQIAASEPRRMRPELSCSGAPSTSSDSTGPKKYRDGLATR